MKQLEMHLAGIRHHVKAQTILEISNVCPMEVKLVREPENAADSNAIRVEAVGEPWDGMHIGYVPQLVARELAEQIDKKRIKIHSAELQDLDSKGNGALEIQFKRTKK